MTKVESDHRIPNAPQFRGAVICAAQGENQKIIQAGVETARLFTSDKNEEISSKKKKKNKLSTSEYIGNIAARMLEHGHTPQEISEVVAKILTQREKK